jgi:hypothetical protein
MENSGEQTLSLPIEIDLSQLDSNDKIRALYFLNGFAANGNYEFDRLSLDVFYFDMSAEVPRPEKDGTKVQTSIFTDEALHFLLSLGVASPNLLAKASLPRWPWPRFAPRTSRFNWEKATISDLERQLSALQEKRERGITEGQDSRHLIPRPVND